MFKVELLSGVGGVGKTTLALALAGHWVKDGAKVAILDCDESLQLFDANSDFEVVTTPPENNSDYDILIIDNAPGTTTPTHNPNVIVYPMLPHSKSLKALERTKSAIKTNNVVFVANRCDFRKTLHRENARLIRALYNGMQLKENAFIENILESGVNFLDCKKDNNYYKAKNDIALIAQRIEQFI